MTEPNELVERRLPWDGSVNIRDLGGYPITGGGHTRWNSLVRADNLTNLTPAGRDALLAYGVKTIVDLRYPAELTVHPNPFANGRLDEPTYHHISLLGETTLDEEDNLFASSRHEWHVRLFDKRAENIAEVMRAIAHAQQGGVLFHCFAGKDRTGVVAALLLDLAGVSHDLIAEDYNLSETYLHSRNAEWLASIADPDERARLAPLSACPTDVMLYALDHLSTRYGGTAGYVRAIGLNEGEIATLRTRIVDDQ